MRTFGLGGDSEIGVSEGGLRSRLTLGPRRIAPLALAAHLVLVIRAFTFRDRLGRLIGDTGLRAFS